MSAASWHYISQVTHALVMVDAAQTQWLARLIAARGLGDIVNVPVLHHRVMVSHIVLTVVCIVGRVMPPSGARASTTSAMAPRSTTSYARMHSVVNALISCAGVCQPTISYESRCDARHD